MQLLPSVSEFLSQRNFQHILNLYSDDLPSFVCFNSELDLWQHKWKADSDLASTLNTPEKTLEQTDPDLFLKHVHSLLHNGHITSYWL